MNDDNNILFNKYSVGLLGGLELPIFAWILLIIVLLFFISSFIQALFNVYIIGISLAVILIVKFASKNRYIKVETVKYAIILGILFFAYNVYVFIQQNQAVNLICSIPIIGQLACSVPILAYIPVLLADIVAFLIWLVVFKYIFKNL